MFVNRNLNISAAVFGELLKVIIRHSDDYKARAIFFLLSRYYFEYSFTETAEENSQDIAALLGLSYCSWKMLGVKSNNISTFHKNDTLGLLVWAICLSAQHIFPNWPEKMSGNLPPNSDLIQFATIRASSWLPGPAVLILWQRCTLHQATNIWCIS